MNDQTNSTTLVQMQDSELIEVMRNSLYPGANPDSVALVLGYCRAANLDPMLKPVHIVPMYTTIGVDRNGKAIKGMRDVIMPGIGMYRIQAARTGQYAGQDEPVFGPSIEFTFQVKKTEYRNNQPVETWSEKTISYPEWCSITIYRMVGGYRSAFTAVEFWTENYATAGRNSDAPNEMWGRRVRGQIAKCAEAQALRKAFPEVGQAPTAEEMEGRYIEPEVVGEVEQPKVKPRRASEAEPASLPTPEAPVVLEPVIPAAVTQPVEESSTPEPAAAPQVAAAAPAPTPAAAPAAAAPAAAPATTPAPAANEPMATAGECLNVIITAKAKKVNLVALLHEQGMTHLNPENLTGLTKAGFKALKGAM